MPYQLQFGMEWYCLVTLVDYQSKIILVKFLSICFGGYRGDIIWTEDARRTRENILKADLDLWSGDLKIIGIIIQLLVK